MEQNYRNEVKLDRTNKFWSLLLRKLWTLFLQTFFWKKSWELSPIHPILSLFRYFLISYYHKSWVIQQSFGIVCSMFFIPNIFLHFICHESSFTKAQINFTKNYRFAPYLFNNDSSSWEYLYFCSKTKLLLKNLPPAKVGRFLMSIFELKLITWNNAKVKLFCQNTVTLYSY